MARDPIMESLGEPEQIFASGQTEPDMRGTLLHEIQHAIQNREGFARGGNPGMFQEEAKGAREAVERVNHALTMISRKMDALRQRGEAPSQFNREPNPEFAKLKDAYDRLMDYRSQVVAEKYDPYQHYRRLAGEVEARNVTQRMDQPPEELVEPIFGEDVPRSKQIVRFRDPNGYAASEPAKPFYSALGKAVETSPLTRAPAEQWLGTIKNMPGVKQEELDWVGVEDWLKTQKGPVSKEQLSDFVRSNQVDVQEVVKGGYEDIRHLTINEQGDRFVINDRDGRVLGNFGDLEAARARLETLEAPEGAGTKFSQYQLPGGENYRELLLTLPAKEAKAKPLSGDEYNELAYYTRIGETLTPEQVARRDVLQAQGRAYNAEVNAGEAGKFKGGHYDEPNVLAHVRFNDRVDANGKKTLFLEEVQSDWHQKGRKQGYQASPSQEKAKQEALAAYHAANRDRVSRGIREPDEAERAAWARVEGGFHGTAEGVPDAPFKTAWPELALKRMVKWAADNGYDQVAWTPGKVQAARYDLSKQVESMKLHLDAPAVARGGGLLEIRPRGDTSVNGIRLQFDKDGKVDSALGGSQFEGKTLDEVVGKEMADKILRDAREPNAGAWGVKNRQSGNWSQRFASKEEAEAYQARLPDSVRGQTDVAAMTTKASKTYSGLDLQVGGEGMNAFYDKMLPAAANKLGKKFGAKVTPTKFVADNPSAFALSEIEAWSLPITDAMRSKAQSEGMPLFTGAPTGSLAAMLMNAIGGDE
jgi:hypothetical protein